jgi:hypothetical protein
MHTCQHMLHLYAASLGSLRDVYTPVACIKVAVGSQHCCHPQDELTARVNHSWYLILPHAITLSHLQALRLLLSS